MRVIRLLSLAGGVFGILLPAALLASTAHGIPDWMEPYIVLVGVALGSGGFFLVAMAGHRMNRDAMLRSFAALLLMVPFGASGVVIWHASNMLMVYLCTFLLILTILLYFSFIYPLTHVPQKPIVSRAASRRVPKPIQWIPLRRNAQRERSTTQTL
ncbi:hypothetical protein NM04_13370 [Massilia aurea]|uniref:Uncharacterized protein n=2 Tax=Massilia TaxID=149698 RepID=A0A422QK16_9BURK|nr:MULTISPECIES: hypothetical protein [Massilia]RNF30252.1 hypothetical protein NM04_13370 [Massilia aurea]TXF96115.1 hypothetical protein FVD38_25525 [Massilia arenae]